MVKGSESLEKIIPVLGFVFLVFSPDLFESFMFCCFFFFSEGVCGNEDERLIHNKLCDDCD